MPVFELILVTLAFLPTIVTILVGRAIYKVIAEKFANLGDLDGMFQTISALAAILGATPKASEDDEEDLEVYTEEDPEAEVTEEAAEEAPVEESQPEVTEEAAEEEAVEETTEEAPAEESQPEGTEEAPAEEASEKADA